MDTNRIEVLRKGSLNSDADIGARDDAAEGL